MSRILKSSLPDRIVLSQSNHATSTVVERARKPPRWTALARRKLPSASRNRTGSLVRESSFSASTLSPSYCHGLVRRRRRQDAATDAAERLLELDGVVLDDGDVDDDLDGGELEDEDTPASKPHELDDLGLEDLPLDNVEPDDLEPDGFITVFPEGYEFD